MSTDYCDYAATIPTLFLGVPEVSTLVAFLDEHVLTSRDGGGVHFRVEEVNREYYRIRGLPDNSPSHKFFDGFPEEFEDGSTTVSLLHQLIEAGKVCLVHESSWSSGGWDEEEAPWDPVGLAEQIPTLILQEVLDKRLVSG